MKIIVIHPDVAVRNALVNWLEDRNHFVMLAQPRPASWSAILAEHEPDLVLMSQDLEGDVEAKVVQTSFPDCQFSMIPDDVADWDAVLKVAESVFDEWRPIVRRFAAKIRFVMHDEGYLAYASTEKLHRPDHSSGWEQIALKQETFFVLQLKTGAAGGHQRAKQYLSVLRRFHRKLVEECAYRQAHSSYKIAWLREELARWMTVLCHYLPDVDMAACPHPQNASPDCVYLHHEMPAAYLYPLICVMQFMPRNYLIEEVVTAASWSFAGQTDEDLARTGYLLFGLNTFYSEIAQAQVSSMEQFLDVGSDFHRRTEVSRSIHRRIGIMMEFWGWEFMYKMGNGLKEVARRVLDGQTYVEQRDGGRIVPTFRQFLGKVTKAPRFEQ